MIVSLTSTPVNVAPAAVAYVPPPVWSQYKGTWASGAIYAINDVVYYAFSSWISLASANSGNAPAIGSAAWQLVAPGVDPTALANATATATAAATTAVAQAAQVSTSLTSASAAAVASAGSATSAEASAASLAAMLASFNTVYLGKKTSDPTTDNNGNALVAGAEYFNTTENKLRIYTAGAWGDYDATAQAAITNASLSAANAAASAANAAAVLASAGKVTGNQTWTGANTFTQPLTFYDSGTQNFFAGIDTEVGAELINFGINNARFGGITKASQGGFIRVDTRPGQSLVQIVATAAGSTTEAVIATIDSSGNLAAAGSLSAANGISAVDNITTHANLIASTDVFIGSLVQSVNTQGCYFGWNRNNGDGAAWIVNQKGGGSGGTYIGECTTGNVFTQSAYIAPAGGASSLSSTLSIQAPGTGDNSSNVPTTSWVMNKLAGLGGAIVSQITSSVGSVTVSLPSGYTQYEIIISNLVAAASGNILMRVATSGTLMDATSGHYTEQYFEAYGLGGYSNNSYRNGDTGFYLGSPSANQTSPPTSIRLTLISNPNGSSQILASYQYSDTSYLHACFLTGEYMPSGALTAIQIISTGGNLTGGTTSVRAIA